MVEQSTAITPIGESLVDNIIIFSQEARAYVREKKLQIYLLSGKSIKELERKSGIKLVLTNTIRVDSSAFNNQRSIRSEVAIDPEEFFLEEAIDKPYHRLQRISDTLSVNVSGVRSVMGTIADYFELYVIHLEATGEDLFEIQNNHNVAVAEFPLDSSKVAIMGKLLKDNDSLIVMTAPRDFVYPGQTLAPIIVPYP